jgi:hypothetical protein
MARQLVSGHLKAFSVYILPKGRFCMSHGIVRYWLRKQHQLLPAACTSVASPFDAKFAFWALNQLALEIMLRMHLGARHSPAGDADVVKVMNVGGLHWPLIESATARRTLKRQTGILQHACCLTGVLSCQLSSLSADSISSHGTKRLSTLFQRRF